MNKRKKRAEKFARCEQIIQTAKDAERELSKQELEELASLRGEIKVLDEQIEAEEWASAYGQKLDNDIEPAPDAPRPDNQAGKPAAGAPAPAGARPNGAPRVDVVASGREHLPFRSLGEQAQAILKAHRHPHNEPDPRLAIVQKAAIDGLQTAAASGLNTVVPSDGGYLVQQDFAGELREHIFAEGTWMNRIQRIPIGQGKNGITLPYLKDHDQSGGSVSAGVLVYLVDEAGQGTATKPSVGKMEISLRKYMGLAYTTEELEEDAPALSAYLRTGFTNQLQYQIAKHIFNGDGASQPMGIMSGSNGSLLQVAKKGGQSADTIIFENVNKMQSRRVPQFASDYVWVAGIDTIEQFPFMKLDVGTGGSAVYLPAGGISGSPYSKLFAIDVEPNSFAPLLGDTGDIILIAPSQYIWVDKGAPQFAVSMHLRFDYGENALRLEYRANGRPGWTAKKKLESTLEVSPFISLETR